MPEKRSSERKPARIRVRFWRPGEPDIVHQGYTANISGTGTFVQTDHPHPKGLRLQVEFTTERNGFVCEALVARAIKVAPELQSAKPSGMGLRFLSVEELLAGFLSEGSAGADAPADDTKCAETMETNPTGSPSHPTESAPTSKPREIEVINDRIARQHPAAAPPRRENETEPPADQHDQRTDTTDPEPKVLTFRLTPPNLDVLISLVERQIQPGILALPCRRDCEVGRPVRVELKTPPSALGQRILAYEGEVLECGQPGPGESSTLRVKLCDNPAAQEFLSRLLDARPLPP